MSKLNLSDEQLIQSICEGREEAFNELYSRYEGKLMGFLVYKVQNQDIAHDIFQTVWSKVVLNVHRFKRKHQFAPWLMAIASNQVKDWFKASSNYSKLLKSYKDELTEDESCEASLPNLSFLKQESQDVLKLRYIEGFTSKEVAEKLRLSESNVRKISSRALKKVKAHIENGGSLL